MPLRFILFLSIFFIVMLVLHGYLGWRLIGPAPLSERARRRAWLGVGLLALIQPAVFGMRMIGVSSGPLPDGIAMGAYVLLGGTVLLFMMVLGRDVLWWKARLAHRFLAPARRAAPHLADPGRRAAMLHGLNLGVLGGGVAGTAYGYWEARRLAQVVETRVPIAGLPRSLEGFSIAQISDVHIGPTIKGGYLQAVVERVNEQKPDLVAVTGDLVDGSVADLGPHTQHLADLEARHGAFFVTGNHEYYSGVEEWVGEMRRLGLTVLGDEHRVLEHDGGRLLLAGIHDLSAPTMVEAHASDPQKAVEGAPETDVRVLLAHQPNSLEKVLPVRVGPEQKSFDLMLSGHTHGGQFIPWNLLVSLAHPVNAGLAGFDAAAGKLWVYVNSGTGYWGPPMRLGVPAEISLLRLVAA